MSLTGWRVLLKNPGPVRERFCGLWMCKHKLEQTPFCTCHNLNPNTLSSSKLLPSKQRSTIFFCLWLCKRKLEQIPFCACQSPNPSTLSSSQLLPTNQGCASRSKIVQTACFAQCTVQCTATKCCKYLGISVVWTTYRRCKILSFLCVPNGVYSALWPCALCVHCSVHCACTVRARCKTRCLCPL